MNVPDLPNISVPAPQLFLCSAQEVDGQGEWLFWSKAPSPILEQSIKDRGQLVPVVVDASGSRPVLIAGAARLQVLSALNRDVLCLDVGAQSLWVKGCMYLASNSQEIVDDSRLVFALRFFHALDAGRLGEVFSALGLDPRSRQARLALSWLKLPRVWDELLAMGHLSLPCAVGLCSFDPDDLQTLFPFFSTWSWSRSGANNVLTWIKEIMIRDRKKAAAVLEALGGQEILDTQLSPKDAMTTLSAAIWSMRFPHWSAMEEKFSTAAKAIVNKTKWQLSHKDQFETGFVELTTRVANGSELQQAITDLVDLGSHPMWDELFEEKD